MMMMMLVMMLVMMLIVCKVYMQQRENAVTFMKQHCYCFLSLWQFCQLFGISQVGCLSQLQTKSAVDFMSLLSKKTPTAHNFPFSNTDESYKFINVFSQIPPVWSEKGKYEQNCKKTMSKFLPTFHRCRWDAAKTTRFENLLFAVFGLHCPFSLLYSFIQTLNCFTLFFGPFVLFIYDIFTHYL